MLNIIYSYKNFLQKKVLASLFLSRDNPDLLTVTNVVLPKLHLMINTVKVHDINLLTVNALWFLLFGQYPNIIFEKSLVKYRKSTIIFRLTFTKKKVYYALLKTIFFACARQSEFEGYLFKTILFLYPEASLVFPIQGLHLFFMIDFLYSQQSKSILRVNQKITLSVDCLFKNANIITNYDSLGVMNVPFMLDQAEIAKLQNQDR